MTIEKYDHVSFKGLITGASGTGKTTLFERVVKREACRLKFIYDHQGEFSARFKIPAVTDLNALVEKTAKGGYVVFDPAKMYPGRSVDGFAFFCDYIFAVSQQLNGRKLLACDELQMLISNSSEPAELLAVLDAGRRYQLDFIAISQAPNRIHNGVRNQLTKVWTFRQSDANAIKYLEENSFDAEAVRNLAVHYHLWRDLRTGEAGQGCEKI